MRKPKFSILSFNFILRNINTISMNISNISIGCLWVPKTDLHQPKILGFREMYQRQGFKIPWKSKQQ